MSKCDHPECQSEAKYYGYQQCYFVCKEHTAWGDEIERRLINEMDDACELLAQQERHDYE